MGADSKIEWTTHTFNPWRGCVKVAPGCAHCYAEAMSKRNPGTLGIWGPNGTRVVASEAMWREPVKWNKQAEGAADRPRVFCASLADVFEDWQEPLQTARGDYLYLDPRDGKWFDIGHHPDDYIDQVNPRACRVLTMSDVRQRLFKLIDDTPNLDWLLVTKRPENIRRMWCAQHGEAPIFPGMPGPLGKPVPCVITNHPRSNVWPGTSISTQKDADRQIPELRKCRDLAPVLFLSIEPLLEPVDLSRWLDPECDGIEPECESGQCRCYIKPLIDWVIVGGESGPNARPCNVEWIRSLIRQCKDAGVPCYVKQLGSQPWDNDRIDFAWTVPRQKTDGLKIEVYDSLVGTGGGGDPFDYILALKDKKGGDWSEWPDDLRVREFPKR